MSSLPFVDSREHKPRPIAFVGQACTRGIVCATAHAHAPCMQRNPYAAVDGPAVDFASTQHEVQCPCIPNCAHMFSARSGCGGVTWLWRRAPEPLLPDSTARQATKRMRPCHDSPRGALSDDRIAACMMPFLSVRSFASLTPRRLADQATRYAQQRRYATMVSAKRAVKIDITSDTVCEHSYGLMQQSRMTGGHEPPNCHRIRWTRLCVTHRPDATYGLVLAGPWCFVGKRRLEKAMERFKDKLEFEVRGAEGRGVTDGSHWLA